MEHETTEGFRQPGRNVRVSLYTASLGSQAVLTKTRTLDK